MAQDELEAGLHNVIVANPEPAGCSATALGAVRITPPPSVTAVEPVLACIEEGDRQLAVQGADFLEVNGVLPAVQLGDFSIAPELISASDCTDLATPGAVVRSGSELTLTVPQDALEAGLYDVTAADADCCEGRCISGTCQPTDIVCQPLGGYCDTPEDCCTDFCDTSSHRCSVVNYPG